MEKGRQWIERLNLKYILFAMGLIMLWFVNQGQWTTEPPQDDIFALEGSTTEISESSQLPETDTSEEPTIIYAEIKGAVMYPGVYSFEEGARVMDLIYKAGGASEEAAMEAINQALLIQDQMSLTVPTIHEWETQQELSDMATTFPMSEDDVGTQETNLVNINTADKQQLETLPGIGPKKAEAILLYRDENGSFQTIEEIMAISGIGEKTFEQLAPLIQVGP